MSWVMIILFYTSGFGRDAEIKTIEFVSQKHCEVAKEKLIQEYRKGPGDKKYYGGPLPMTITCMEVR